MIASGIQKGRRSKDASDKKGIIRGMPKNPGTPQGKARFSYLGPSP